MFSFLYQKVFQSKVFEHFQVWLQILLNKKHKSLFILSQKVTNPIGWFNLDWRHQSHQSNWLIQFALKAPKSPIWLVDWTCFEGTRVINLIGWFNLYWRHQSHQCDWLVCVIDTQFKNLIGWFMCHIIRRPEKLLSPLLRMSFKTQHLIMFPYHVSMGETC